MNHLNHLIIIGVLCAVLLALGLLPSRAHDLERCASTIHDALTPRQRAALHGISTPPYPVITWRDQYRLCAELGAPEALEEARAVKRSTPRFTD
jgi:hypothetical protein